MNKFIISYYFSTFKIKVLIYLDNFEQKSEREKSKIWCILGTYNLAVLIFVIDWYNY